MAIRTIIFSIAIQNRIPFPIGYSLHHTASAIADGLFKEDFDRAAALKQQLAGLLANRGAGQNAARGNPKLAQLQAVVGLDSQRMGTTGE